MRLSRGPASSSFQDDVSQFPSMLDILFDFFNYQDQYCSASMFPALIWEDALMAPGIANPIATVNAAKLHQISSSVYDANATSP